MNDPDLLSTLSENLAGLLFIGFVLLVLFFGFFRFMGAYLNNTTTRLLNAFEQNNNKTGNVLTEMLKTSQLQINELSKNFILETRENRSDFLLQIENTTTESRQQIQNLASDFLQENRQLRQEFLAANHMLTGQLDSSMKNLKEELININQRLAENASDLDTIIRANNSSARIDMLEKKLESIPNPTPTPKQPKRRFK